MPLRQPLAILALTLSGCGLLFPSGPEGRGASAVDADEDGDAEIIVVERVAGHPPTVSLYDLDGTRRWVTDVPDMIGLQVHAVARNGVVVVTATDGHLPDPVVNGLTGLDVASGKLLWSRTHEGMGAFPHTIDDALLIAYGNRIKDRPPHRTERLVWSTGEVGWKTPGVLVSTPYGWYLERGRPVLVDPKTGAHRGPIGPGVRWAGPEGLFVQGLSGEDVIQRNHPSPDLRSGSLDQAMHMPGEVVAMADSHGVSHQVHVGADASTLHGRPRDEGDSWDLQLEGTLDIDDPTQAQMQGFSSLPILPVNRTWTDAGALAHEALTVDVRTGVVTRTVPGAVDFYRCDSGYVTVSGGAVNHVDGETGEWDAAKVLVAPTVHGRCVDDVIVLEDEGRLMAVDAGLGEVWGL